MTDVVTPDVRSRMMARIRSKNTKPEILVRQELHRRGYRYRIHAVNLPGKPDVIFPKRRAAIFINGCFWHGHDCHLFKWPRSRHDFWREKIIANKDRDARVALSLSALGWRKIVIWECALKGKSRLPVEALIDQVAFWIDHGTGDCEIAGASDV